MKQSWVLACALVVALVTTACGEDEKVVPVCGNGILEVGEACDDGNTIDTDGCTATCQIAICGDGIVQEGVEECDDGNDSNEDACLNTCKANVCGDGFVHEGVEACDDGNDDETDGCTSECVSSTCGDGIVQPETEECDDGNNVDGDGCTNSCLLARCGDGIVQEGIEACDDGAENSDTVPGACRTDCSLPTCGDGVVDEGEACDDGNADDTDECLSSCEWNVCGDGFVHAGVEACDDGEENSDTVPGACRTDCSLPTCGDGVVDEGEACDDGEANSDTEPGACRTNCAFATCGDGVVDEGEACDDGEGNSDTEPGACRTNCTVARCGDGVVDEGEACDDGNESNADACLNSCEWNTCGDGFVHEGEEACDDGEENSDSGSGACRTDCSLPVCGDGVVDPGEGCDDGTNAGGAPDVCRPGCVAPTCGDGIQDEGEECDDGNLDGGDGCSAICQIECGNGVVDPGELCDDGNTNDGDGCDSTCQLEPWDIIDAGNDLVIRGAIEPTDPTAPRSRYRQNSCQTFSSSSSYITHYDVYEIRNPHKVAKTISIRQEIWMKNQAYLVAYYDFDPDAPWNNCFASNGGTALTEDVLLEGITLAPGESIFIQSTTFSLGAGYGDYTLTISVANACGDGYQLDGEACDDGNLEDGDGCDATCNIEQGYHCPNPGEACLEAVCGNGVIEGIEQCDDGNPNDGDGCSSLCHVETGYVCDTPPGVLCRAISCGDGIIDHTEQCEPGLPSEFTCVNCMFEGDSCQSAFVAAPTADDLSFEIAGLHTENFTDTQAPTCRSVQDTDAFVAFTSPVDARWRFTATPDRAAAALILSVRDTCDDVDTERACVWESGNRPAWLDVELAANETVYIQVDLSSSSSYHTPFTISGEGRPILPQGASCDPDYETSLCGPGLSCDETTLVCTAAVCGDGIVDTVAGEQCDDLTINCVGCMLKGDTCADAFDLNASPGDRPNVFHWNARTHWYENDGQLSCGGPYLNDGVATFLVPETGEYTFDLRSTHNPILEILEGACGEASSLECLSKTTGTERFTRRNLTQGQLLTIGIDGYRTNSSNSLHKPGLDWEGEFSLTVAKLECGNGILQPGESCDDGNLVDGDGCSSTCIAQGDECSDPYDLNALDQNDHPDVWEHHGSTATFSPNYPGCSSNGAAARPEAVYKFTAPRTGHYLIKENVAGSSFNAVLSLWFDCPAPNPSDFYGQLECTNDAHKDELPVFLNEGQTYFIMVDEYGTTQTVPGSGGGKYELTVNWVGP